MKKFYIKSATAEDFRTAEVGDWVEGCGYIMTLFEQDFIRRFWSYRMVAQSSPCPGYGCKTELRPFTVHVPRCPKFERKEDEMPYDEGDW